MDNCHSCGQKLDSAIAEIRFSGFEKARLNGVSFRVHARCLRLEPTERNIELPPRIPEPAADTEQVMVYLSDFGWTAFCRDCHKVVAQKSEVDDAHLLAAMHIARVHSGLVVTHGRHCICTACGREDWTNPRLAHCGMHGPDCPPVYAPLAAAGHPVPVPA